MAPTDASISKTVDDTKKAKATDQADAKHFLDDVYDIKKQDSGKPEKLQSDYNDLTKRLHDQGILPGLVISDSNNGSLTETKDSGGPFEKGASKVTPDPQGRVSEIQGADGSVTKIAYDGGDRNPNKVTTTYKDGTVVTYDKGRDQWTETTKPVQGDPVVNYNIDWLRVSTNGDVTTCDGTVTTISHNNGSREVTSQAEKDGPKTTARYYYDSNGQLSNASRTNEDGTSETFGRTADGQWTRRTTTASGETQTTEPVSNVRFNPDGGMSYDSGKSHVTVEGYGARHVTEDTAYGSYSQAFDPSGKLTTSIRTDNASGKTELVSYLDNGKGSLLVYDTKNPENYYAPDVTVHPDGSYSYKAENGSEVIDRKTDFSGDGLNQTPLDPAISKIAKDNGVDVTRTVVDGYLQYEYSVTVSGEKETVLTTDASPDQTDAKLKDIRDEKLAQVEADNHVRFSRAGGSTEVDGEQVPTTTPNIGQIYGTEAALVRSVPDLPAKDGKPLEIDFLEHQGKNPSIGGFASGNSRVVIEPNGGQDGGPTAVEGLFLHELAHNGQANLYGDDKTLEDHYANQLGFVRAGDNWLLITKDGRYFKSVPGKDNVGSGGWVRTDKDGNPIDENGNKSDHPQQITNDEARNIALVKPATTYFPNPAEAGADAARSFRGGTDSRAQFLRDNPETYAAYKQLDQLAINKAYGLDDNGQPKYIRNPDGIPVPNTPESRAEVQKFENDVMNPPNVLGGFGSLGGMIAEGAKEAGHK